MKMASKQKKSLVAGLWVATMVLAGFYGASWQASRTGLKKCQEDGRQECHIEFSLAGFEALGE